MIIIKSQNKFLIRKVIVKHLKRINEKIEDLIESKDQFKDYGEKRIKIYNLINKTEDLIHKSAYLDKEFYDFLMLERITRYILEDKELFLKHHNYLLELFKDYYDIIKYRFEYNSFDYEKEYERFEYCFNRKTEFFYLEIYERSGIYDDLIDEIVRILG